MGQRAAGLARVVGEVGEVAGDLALDEHLQGAAVRVVLMRLLVEPRAELAVLEAELFGLCGGSSWRFARVGLLLNFGRGPDRTGSLFVGASLLFLMELVAPARCGGWPRRRGVLARWSRVRFLLTRYRFAHASSRVIVVSV